MSEKGNWGVVALVVGVVRRTTLSTVYAIYGMPLVTSRNQWSLPRSLACLLYSRYGAVPCKLRLPLIFVDSSLYTVTPRLLDIGEACKTLT